MDEDCMAQDMEQSTIFAQIAKDWMNNQTMGRVHVKDASKEHNKFSKPQLEVRVHPACQVTRLDSKFTDGHITKWTVYHFYDTKQGTRRPFATCVWTMQETDEEKKEPRKVE